VIRWARSRPSRALSSPRPRQPRADYLEAPVLGSIGEAAAGRLVVMPAPARLFERWLPLLRALGPEPRLNRRPGAPPPQARPHQLIATITTAYRVGLGMVRRSGVDLADWTAIVRSSALYAPTFDKKLPRMIDRDFTPANFPARLLLKDLRLWRTRPIGSACSPPSSPA